MYMRSRSSLSSRVIMFLLLSCTVEGGSRASRTRTRQVPLEEGVCIFAVAAVVYILVLYTARHRQEYVMEVVRVESAESPLTATAVVKAPPRGTGVHVCEIISSHVIMFLLLL